MTKPTEPTITMPMSELRALAESIAKDYEPRIAKLERFVNRLAREIGDMDNGRAGMSLEGEEDA